VPSQLHAMEQHRSPKHVSVQLATPPQTAFGTHCPGSPLPCAAPPDEAPADPEELPPDDVPPDDVPLVSSSTLPLVVPP